MSVAIGRVRPKVDLTEARRMAEGKAAGDDGWEPDAKEKMAQEWVAAIGKALSPLAHNSQEVLAMTLELFNA